MSAQLPTNKQLGAMVDRAAAQTGVSARRQRRWIAVARLSSAVHMLTCPRSNASPGKAVTKG
jgi:hypothetical protein